ncbi:MAG TPA: type IV pilin protein [Burkholderiales bacterium]|nr:type IV pilin protein [Burkholderiales bacterium]
MKRHTGFTLIELMVTVAIVAILAAIALPNYTAYLARGKIAEATTNMLAMKTKLEQYFQDNRTFAGACAAGTTAPLPPPYLSGGNPGELRYVKITCSNLTATTYTIQADGMDSSIANLTLTIDQANVRRTVSVPAGWGMPTQNCWVSKKSGDC